MDRTKFFDLANEIYQLHTAKAGDYGDERQYFPFGDASYVQMLHVKNTRLIALLNGPGEPNFESIEDTVRDLINYSFFYLDFLKEKDE